MTVLSRRTIAGGLFALAAALAVHLWTAELPASQQRASIIFAAAVILWITEAMPLAWTAVGASVMMYLLGCLSFRSLLFSYLDPVTLLIFGGFLLAEGLAATSLDRAFAHSVLSRRTLTSSAPRLLGTLTLIACLLSLGISNSGVAAMLLPIGLHICRSLKESNRKGAFQVGILLSLGWGASIAVGLPIGTPPNLMAQSQLLAAGHPISFSGWMLFGVPINIVLFFLSWGLLTLLYGRGNEPIDKEVIGERKEQQLNAAQRRVWYVLLLVITLWLVPDPLSMLLPKDKAQLLTWLSPTNVSLFGAALLMLLPVPNGNGKRLLPLSRVGSINWGCLLLFGGGIALGKATSDSGLAATLGKEFLAAVGSGDLFVLVAASTAVGVLVSEFASNTASAAIVLPLVISAAQVSGFSPVAPALGAALGANLGFMMPISTPPNSIIYSSGLIPARQMMLSGLLLDITGYLTVVFGLRLLLPLFGWW